MHICFTQKSNNRKESLFSVIDDKTRITAHLLCEETGEVKLCFEPEDLAQFLDTDLRIFFDKLINMIHFILEKRFAGGTVEVEFTRPIKGTQAHGSLFAEFLQRRLSGQIPVKDRLDLCRLLTHGILGYKLL